jgi:hypothetical protein
MIEAAQPVRQQSTVRNARAHLEIPAGGGRRL